MALRSSERRSGCYDAMPPWRSATSATRAASRPSRRHFRTDDHPLVRGHAAWALGQIGRRTGAGEAWKALQAALSAEGDPEVRGEIIAAQGFRPTVPERGEPTGYTG